MKFSIKSSFSSNNIAAELSARYLALQNWWLSVAYLNGTKFEPAGYSFTISDVRVTSQFFGSGVQTKAAQALAAQNASQTITNGTATSQTVIGTNCTIVATGVNTLFGSNNILYATLVVIGLDSGARASVPLQITKTTTAS